MAASTLTEAPNQVRCPYVGPITDTSVYLSPSDDYHCAAKHGAPISAAYQSQVCLTPRFLACRLYTAQKLRDAGESVDGQLALPIKARRKLSRIEKLAIAAAIALPLGTLIALLILVRTGTI